jgi:hypothetical protein
MDALCLSCSRSLLVIGRLGVALRGLTPQSRGRPQAGFAHLRPPLTSNVSPLPRSPREAVVEQSPSASVPALNANGRVFQRWSQQALPAASTATAAQLVPSVATHQACAAGPSQSGLPHTPAARFLSTRRPPGKAAQYKRPRCVGGSLSQSESGACSRFLLPSFEVGNWLAFRSWPFVASARLLRSNTRLAKPAEMQRSSFGRRAFLRLRANPSIKRTCLRQAAYVER